MAEPAVSVLMPVYNGGRYLREAVDSVLGQTMRDFELVMVDDGSTDGSARMLNRYAHADRRVRIRRRPNTGIVKALNDGLALCRAPLVARMDADDVSRPDRLMLQCQYMHAHPECVMVGSRVTLIDPQGLPIRDWVDETDHDSIDASHLARGWPVVHPAVLMRTHAVRQAGGYREEYAWLEDVDLFLRLAEIGKLANLPEPLLRYRQHFESICHTQARIDTQRSIRDKLLGETCRRRAIAMPAAGQAPRPNSRSDYHRRWAWWALKSGNLGTARKHALRVIARRPISPKTWRLVFCALRGR